MVSKFLFILENAKNSGLHRCFKFRVHRDLFVRKKYLKGGLQQFFWPWSVSFEIKISHRRQTSIAFILQQPFQCMTKVNFFH